VRPSPILSPFMYDAFIWGNNFSNILSPLPSFNTCSVPLPTINDLIFVISEDEKSIPIDDTLLKRMVVAEGRNLDSDE